MTSKPIIPNIPGAGKLGTAPKNEQYNLPGNAPQEPVFTEDFTDVELSTFRLVSEGYHTAKVVDFEKGVSKAGNPQYIWDFLITSGPDTGFNLKFYTALIPKARWKAVETLEAVGIAAEGSVARFTRKEILGRPCILEVEHDEFESNTQPGKMLTSAKIVKVHAADNAAILAAADNPDEVPF